MKLMRAVLPAANAKNRNVTSKKMMMRRGLAARKRGAAVVVTTSVVKSDVGTDM